MPRSSRKKQKTIHIQRSNVNPALEVREHPKESHTEEKKLVLFGKSITMDEQDLQASYYAKLRTWFCHAVPTKEDTSVPRMGGVASTETCASPSITRLTNQELDGALSDDSFIFQRTPAPLPTVISPYPLMVPLKRNKTLSASVINDPKSLLEHHKTHWKKVRKNWILHRQLYLQRYKPCLDFIKSTCAQPLHE